MSEWTTATENLPESGRCVLAAVKNSHGNTRVIRAFYAAPRTIEDDGDFPGNTEYDEEKDTYYWPEGWYEYNEYEETHWHVDDVVTHWMPLPNHPDSNAVSVDQGAAMTDTRDSAPVCATCGHENHHSAYCSADVGSCLLTRRACDEGAKSFAPLQEKPQMMVAPWTSAAHIESPDCRGAGCVPVSAVCATCGLEATGFSPSTGSGRVQAFCPNAHFWWIQEKPQLKCATCGLVPRYCFCGIVYREEEGGEEVEAPDVDTIETVSKIIDLMTALKAALEKAGAK